MNLEYLRAPAFANGRCLHVGASAVHNCGEEAANAVEAVFTSARFGAGEEGHRATALAGQLVAQVELPIEQMYDFVVLEQGYGGVFVHAYDLVAKLRRQWRVLFLSPGDPFFGAGRHEDDWTLPRLVDVLGPVSYFQYVGLVRDILRKIVCRTLLITHRSQSLYVFDIIPQHHSIIYCDGYFDAGLMIPSQMPTSSKPSNREILREVMFALGNGPPGFHGVPGGPGANMYMLWAGYAALIGAAENWCWGVAQRDAFVAGAPELVGRLTLQLPFVNLGIFQPGLVRRDAVALFTTTMHNIDKKGIDPMLQALEDLPDLHVQCVVRQPRCLPRIPSRVRSRVQVASLTKVDMLSAYHSVWVNCRLSTEESSPLSVLESMACEVPQIVSPTVAKQIPILEDGVTGYIVEPSDRQRIAACLEDIIRDKARRDDMGRAARERVRVCSADDRMLVFEEQLRRQIPLVNGRQTREGWLQE